MYDIPFRQIHLDFHTSGLIPDVGRDFRADEFADTLKAARVQSINIFAKCHHGFAYYPSKIVPPHPSLKVDMLGGMIEALHKRGIKCPVYVTVVWDEWAAAEHPEWLQMDSQGRVVGRAPYSDGESGERWKYLCVNTGYLDYVAAQTEELLANYDVDGMWYDILKYDNDGCSCKECQRGMLAAGLDPADVEHRRDYSYTVLAGAMRRLFEITKARKPDALVFFNGRQRIDANPDRSLRKELKYITHFELESLPSGEWGYYHFPLYVRYNQIFGLQIIGMNGRFHRSWADFGGYKNRAALEFECFSMLANGAKVCVGDQLHPRGRLEPTTYDLIGSVFADIETKEPWCAGARPVADIGLMIVNDGEYGPYLRPRIRHLEGAMQVLLEDRRLFQVIDRECNFSKYKLIVCPDLLRFDAELAAKFKAYLASGGKLLLSYESGLKAESDEFALDFGIEAAGFSEYRTSYLRLKPAFRQGGLTEADYVVYDNALNVKPGKAEVLAELVKPYFDRSWDHFMSHAQTPPDGPSGFAGAARKGGVVYFAHPIFGVYKRHGNRVFKQLASNALDLLIGGRLVSADLPSTAQLNLLEQPEQRRRVVHVLHYPRERRAAIDIIEDIIPLFNVKMSVRSAAKPKRIYLAPSKKELEFEWADGAASFVVPEIRGHQMVAIED